MLYDGIVAVYCYVENLLNLLSIIASSGDGRFLHESKVPTLHFQPSLPRLPIPPLDKTCQRYLNAQKPISNEVEYANTVRLVEEFQNGPGKG